MWWKAALKVAVMLGLDSWAKKKAVEIASKLRKRAANKADGILEAAGTKAIQASGAAGSIVVREERDVLRPGSVVVQNDRSYRVVKLLFANKLGAFYEAVAE